MNEALTARDLRASLGAIRSLSEVATEAEFASRACAALSALIRCDSSSYTEVDLLSGQAWGVTDPLDVQPVDAGPVLAAHAGDNPLIGHGMAFPNDDAHCWSDFLSGTELRRTDLYGLLYRPMGIEHQMAVTVMRTASSVGGVTVNRQGRDFSWRDRAVLSLLRPHLVAALERVRLLEKVAGAGMATSPEVLEPALVTIGREGRIRHVTPRAAELVGSHLGQPLRPGAELDGELATWLSGSGGRRRSGSVCALTASYLPGADRDLILLEEDHPAPTGSRRGSRSALWGGGSRPTWSVSALGGFRVTFAGEPVAVVGRPATVIKVVAVSGRRIPAEAVIEAVWPELEPSVGLRRLRNVLHRVPRRLTPLLVRDGPVLALAEDVELDIDRFEAEAVAALGTIRDGRAGGPAMGRRALGRYAPVLPEEPYEDWASQARDRIRRRYLQLVDGLAAACERDGLLADAVQLLRQGIDADPVDERRYLLAARFLLAGGWPLAARAVLDDLRQVYARLDLPPSGDLLRLEDEVRSGPHGLAS